MAYFCVSYDCMHTLNGFCTWITRLVAEMFMQENKKELALFYFFQ